MLRIFILLFVLITKGIDMSSLISFFKKNQPPLPDNSKKTPTTSNKNIPKQKKRLMRFSFLVYLTSSGYTAVS